MALRMGLGLLMLLVLHATCTWMCDARPLTGSSEMLNTGLGSKNNQACPWCETYVTREIEFLDQNKTQQDIISLLHKSCSHLRSLEGDCAALVDYYAPLFFEEVSTIHPQQFCEKVRPCDLLEISSQTIDGAVKEMISKLNDPDTQLDILVALLDRCASLEKKFVKQCKRVVFAYGQFAFNNGGKLF